MLDPRVKKLADMLVNYSLEVKKGDKVMINFIGASTEPLARELITSVVNAGGVPFWVFDDSPLSRRFVAEADVDQMTTFGDVHKSVMEQMDCYCGVRGSDNKFEMAGLPAEQMKNYKKLFGEKVHMQERVPNTRWAVMRWPNASMAQQSGKCTEEFEDFYFDVCTLDYAKMSAAMDKLVDRLHNTDKVRIVAQDTDISFSIKGIPAIKCDGKLNIPDGEVFTAPVKDSVNGRITYNTPSTQEGVMYEGVSLEFADGKIVSIDAKNDVESLRKVFEVDEGAKYVGEFAIGVNPYILHPMNDTLFDEKIAGSIHFTPGNSYDDAPNGNKSSLHWDMVLIQREDYGGGELFFDGELVRKDGMFIVDDLKCLNPDELK